MSDLSELLRPTSFEDLLQPPSVVTPLQRMAATKRMQNMLFYGMPGVGKTSAAKILLARLGNNEVCYNGSKSTGIDVIREMEIAAGNMGVGEGPRIIFIDEAEYMSKQAQAGLRAMIEDVHGHCRFLLIANDISKFHPALKSRCIPVCFDISITEVSEVIKRSLPRYLSRLKKAGVKISDKRAGELYRLHFPDHRALANAIEFEDMATQLKAA